MQQAEPTEGPRWKPLERNERRVLGVLVEKAKTTPSAYPLTINAIRTGSNQKSNRFPQMDLEEHHVEEALEGLREHGAVTFLQGDGRAEKYRHHAYDWLGVDKVELAVMAELLLRGAQTLGELRGRAARMEPIKGQSELQPIVNALVERGLVAYLTPQGRGAVVTHNLYQPQELAKVKADLGISGNTPAAPLPAQPQVAPVGTAEAPPAAAQAKAAPQPSAADADADELRDQVRQLRAELTEARVELQSEIQQLRTELEELSRLVGG